MTNPKGTLLRPMPAPQTASWPVVTPIYPSVVYASETPDTLDAQYEGRLSGYTYSREGHPNADVVSRRVGALEGIEGGTLMGSGMGAVSAVLLGLFPTGSHIIGGNQLYGRSLRMMNEDLPRLGFGVSLVDACDADAVKAAIRPETKAVLIEVVANPTLRIADVDGIAAVCREAGVLLVVDNTFTTPRGLKAFDHGADIVIHSLTKLLGGHSDVMLGWVGAKDPDIAARLDVFSVTAGFVPSPFDCWLAERGLLTFPLRYDAAEANAVALADHLAGLPGVARVIYPGRPDHPDANRAAGLLEGKGGNMLSLELHGGRAAANAFTTAAEGLAFAPTLGDVGTTISHPASSSHRAMTAEAREALGISEGFFRLSVGLEERDALTEVLTRAVKAASAP
ncbi:trans-sulfuration enzyme family protein [Chachezhania antarctica]|uniref:trans-sulfuration enzyme family protein n=1 Tax=Chachezhania antarctica TaxID=2340860 RepID=UPI000EB31B87|nr:aminotransferase class I/II-fold pyridoxal phosphate-dependent enzyme [Chachezhania antarctica]|tara:strand:- start:2630 stop:3814 length:1185 start_codon:yes stop_codon:yes gene_type:complete